MFDEKTQWLETRLKKIVAVNLEGKGVLEVSLLCVEFAEGLSSTYSPKECHLLGSTSELFQGQVSHSFGRSTIMLQREGYFLVYQILHILLHYLVSFCCFGRSPFKSMDIRLESAILVLIFGVAPTRLVP